MRFKNRYLLVEVLLMDHDGNAVRKYDAVTPQAIGEAVRREIALNFGELGTARCTSSLNVKYYHAATGLVILRCARETARDVWCSVTSVSSLARTPALLRVVHSAGTIRSCRKAAIEHSRRALRLLIARLPPQAVADAPRHALSLAADGGAAASARKRLPRGSGSGSGSARRAPVASGDDLDAEQLAVELERVVADIEAIDF